MAGVVRNEELRRFTGTGLRILAVAAAYLLVGRLGLLEQVVLGSVRVAPLWPPTGIAVSCLLLMGLRVWPGIALGALLVIATIGPVTAASAGVVAGNTLAPICAVLLLRRVDFRVELDRFRDGAALVFLGALIAMLLSATMGSGALLISGSLSADNFWGTWAAWWTGDAMGVLVITPVLLAARTIRLPLEIRPARWLEATALLLSTIAVALIGSLSTLHLLFLVFPLLIWAALRFELAGAAPCVLLVSVISVMAAGRQVGPFADHDLFALMVTLQALNGAAALTTLLLVAVVAERRSTYLQIERACVALAEVVARLAPGDGTSGRPPSDGGRGHGS
ncbi:MASE1 domain-containing protein [Kitasatospora sp. NBC_00315]|uniref:MASE1 domain-containing protein n=1 Tax=Kitasatospora sp. NBC_00315 TaxID=2975963 RepID=UPI00325349C1